MEFFKDWDTQSWVRSRRMTPYEGEENFYFFKPILVPVSLHPDVKERSKDIAEELQILHLYNYLDATDSLETDIINKGLLNIIRNQLPFELPPQVNIDAYKIYTDEGYHAYMSHFLKKEIEKITHKTCIFTKKPQNILILETILEKLPKDLYNIAHILACITNETLISGSLLQANDIALNPMVRTYIEAHARDEAKHHLYFAALLKLIWPQLMESEKKLFGTLLPLFIKAFLKVDTSRVFCNLTQVGFTHEEAEKIIQDSYHEDEQVKNYNKSAKATLRHFKDNDIFSLKEIREAFIEEGFYI